MSDTVSAPSTSSTTSVPAPATGHHSAPSKTPNSSTSAVPPVTSGKPSGAIPPPVKPGALGADSVTSASEAGAQTETAQQKADRKRKLKVFGKEEEVDLGSLSDDDLVRALQKGKAADRVMQDAAELRRQWQEAVEHIKKDPFSALKNEVFGVDLEKLAEERLAQKYQEMTMPEQERKMLQLQRELEAVKQREAQQKTQQETVARKQFEDAVAKQTEDQFVKALTEHDLPVSRETIYMMAEVAKVNLDHGIELDERQLAAEVRHRLTGMHQHVTKSLKGEQLIKYLGDDIVKEILAYSVEQAKAKRRPTGAPPIVEQKIEDADEKSERRMQDYRKTREYFRR
jgi:hypothetical protein